MKMPSLLKQIRKCVSVLVVLLLLCTASNGRSSDRVRKSAARDRSRYRNAINKIRTTKKTSSSLVIPDHHRRALLENVKEVTKAVKLPLFSAAEYLMGDYVTEIEIGTPPKKLRLIIDTASDLTWIHCRYGKKHHHDEHNTISNQKKNECENESGTRRKPFQGDKSKSFRIVPCRSRSCSSDEFKNMFALDTKCEKSLPCLYNYRYLEDDITAFGFFAHEMITYPLTTTISNHAVNKSAVHLRQLIGCTVATKETGRTSIFTFADGVLGLTLTNYSIGHIATRELGGGKFSYCLVDHVSPANKRGHFVFGVNDELTKLNRHGQVQITKLELLQAGYYAFDTKGISVDGVMLDIPSKVWDFDARGGLLLECGMTYTILAGSAYDKVMHALTQGLFRRFPKLEPIGEILNDFAFCFNSTTAGYQDSKAPKMVVHFKDGANFAPPVNNYVIKIGFDLDFRCIGIMPGIPDEASFMGNVMQQNHLWQFDLLNGKLAYGPSQCT